MVVYWSWKPIADKIQGKPIFLDQSRVDLKSSLSVQKLTLERAMFWMQWKVEYEPQVFLIKDV
jgi:predicted ATPase